MSHTRRARSSLESWRRPWGVARKTLLMIVAGLAGLALLWTLAIGWALPRFAQPRIEAAASDALGAPLRLGRLEIAPWSLVVTVADVQLGPADAPWLELTQGQADLSVESLWRLAPVLERLSLREPRLRLERLAADRYNITPMLEALARRPSEPGPAKPVHFAIYNIRLQDGRIDLLDRVSNREHRVEALQVGVPFVSNLPSKLTVDVEPLLDARVNGSRLLVQGKTQPFHEGLRSTIAIDWQQLDVAQWSQALAPLLPAPSPVTVAEGELALALQIAFERRGADGPPSLRISGGARLSKLRAALPARGLQFGWDQLDVDGLDLEPLARRAAVATVRLQAPDARIDLPTLLAPAAADRPAPPPAAPASAPATDAVNAAWQWKVGELDVAEGSASVLHPAWPQGQRIAPLTVNLKGLDSRADASPATLALALKDAQGGAFKLDATLSAGAAKAEGTAEAQGFDVPTWLAPWQALLPVRLQNASVSLGAKAEVSASGWAVRDAQLALDDVKLQPADAGLAARKAVGDRLAVQRVALSGVEAAGRLGAADAAVNVQARALTIEGLDLQASRRKDGAIGWLPRTTTSAGAEAESAPSGLRWKLDELRCIGCALAFADQSVEPASSFALQRTDITLKRLGDDLSQPLTFDVATQARQGGRIKLAGTLRPQPLALRSRVEVAALDLRMLQPYLQPRANVELATAKLSAAGDVLVEGTAKTAVGAAQWRGRLGLAELRVLDSLNQAELLRFKSLQLDGTDLRWRADAPLQADLGAVSLQDFYSRIIVNADGRLNLLDIVKREGQEAPKSLTTPSESAASAATPAAVTPAAVTPDTARAQLRWRSIALAGGTVDFTDNFIRPNYSAKLTDLSGSVAALAWDDPQPATVAIAGKVDGSAPLEITGSVHPLGARLATDIAASARGIDITRLTGYSGRYAGYGIEKGTLSVKVRYKIANGQLEADNNLYLDQLTFGDKVDSPDALKLPVLLAVSLLKDRNGVIDLDLPIRGSLDDPQFSVGGIIVKVIVNLITKAVTAPFSLLANAFGGGGQELGHVDFGPGSSDLSDASRQRLDTLAKALNDRPALRLEATGHADATRDDAALRVQHVERLMRVAKAKSTGELPDSVKIEPAERARWLEAAYKAADLKDKPRNALGLNKSLPPAEMEALLLKHATAGEPALKALADARGDRVKAYLVTQVPPERVLLTASKVGAPAGSEGGTASSVVFGLR